jgi:hypothetical protein
MRVTGSWSRTRSVVVLAVLVASACATQMEQPEEEGPVESPTGGTGGDAAGTMSMGGSLDAMMGMGGTLPMGGVMNGGTGGSVAGTGAGGTAGKGMGGKAGTGNGGANATGGKGGGAGMTMMTTGGTGGKAGSGGRAGGGTGGATAGGASGRGSGGLSNGGRSSGGTSGASVGGMGGGSAGTSGQKCVTWTTAPQSSGNIGNSAACFDVSGTMAGWQVSNLGERTLLVNGKAAMPPTVPAAVDGHRIFEFSIPPQGDDIGKNCSWSYW